MTDAEPIRLWRNTQLNLLRQTHKISREEQAGYFQQQVVERQESSDPVQILTGIWSGSELLGYGGLVHISWPNLRAEISFLLRPELETNYEEKVKVFGFFLGQVIESAFNRLRLNRIFTETFASRHQHIEVLERYGFRLEGKLAQQIQVSPGVFDDSVIHGLTRGTWAKEAGPN